ncbi:MAG: hypothetical protein HN712_02190 [Gemmatimonadetes bacterium]|jgi:hypothetical protein|nr:hypothetical protein [Gemmatimonadota bacterium]MBT6150336.1 hypothetical protein [Gemmatimonadota bacterium]MBT7859085.1 hypothetical protein [Gemmatimonadota bacterium]
MRKSITQPQVLAREGAVILTWYQSTPLFSGEVHGEFARFRILRKQVNFVFGEDYQEYFLGLGPEGAHVIHDGPLEAHNRRRYTFHDDTAESGQTYAYFIESVSSGPIGPLPVRIRDADVWWSEESITARLEALCERAGQRATLSICGQTAMGRKIPCLTLGDGPRTIGLVGLIHGGESGPELIIPAMEHLLDEAPELLDHVRIVALPAVNLDARQAQVDGTPWYLRTNQQCVDLNRNFPTHWETTEFGYGLDSSDPTAGTYRGPRPASAPETAAVLSVFEMQRPDVVFSYHCLASICGVPALTSRYAEQDADFAQHAEALLQPFARGLHPDLGYETGWLGYGCSAGSLPAWLYERYGIPAFDLEAGADPEALQKCRVDATDRALLEDYQLRHARALREVATTLAT